MKSTHRLSARLAVAAVTGALLLSSCASTDDDADSKSDDTSAAVDRGRYAFGLIGDQPEAGEPVEGGTLNFADYGEIRSLSPAASYATGASGGGAMVAVYDTLMTLDTETQAYEPKLAESLESSDDLKTWTLTLREGVNFSDGTPLDAKAVVASINWYMTSQGADTAMLAPNLAGMEVTDERTVVFNLNNAWAKFPSMLAQAAGMIVAPAAYAGAEFKPIGAGAFTLDEYKPAEELTLTANPDYWDGKPHLDGLRFFWPLADEAKLDALNDGSADVAFMRDPKVVDQAVDADVSGHLTLTSLGNTITINNREGYPGSDPRVRKAIALAYDPELDYKRSYDGKGMPGMELFPPESKWDTSDEALEADLDEATKLVEEAKADGFDGVVTYLDGTDPTSRTQAVAMKAMLERVGFTVKTDLVASIADQTSRVFVDHDFDIARGAMSVSESDPYHRLISNLSSTSYGNASGYASEEMDAALVELQAAGSDEEIQTVLDKIQEIFNEEVPVITTGANAAIHAWNDNVYGVEMAAEYMPDFSDAWLVP
ncbi:ABC transporter substrate-binding protein [Nocardioides pacificus]